MSEQESVMKDEVISALCSSIIEALAVFEKVHRRFHPLILSSLHDMLTPLLGPLEIPAKESVSDYRSSTGKDFGSALKDSADLIVQAIHLFDPVDDIQQGIMNSLKAHRKICRVQEILYPFSYVSPMIDSYFLEHRLTERVPGSGPEAECPGESVGICHKGLDNDPYARGSLSIYVPESYSGLVPLPLVIALHGGFSHGRDFLWTWLREARSRDFILAAPTSQGSTWSIGRPQIDLESLISHANDLGTQYNIDRKCILLTGISDGATFALTCSLQKNTIFNNIAPISGVLVPSDLAGVKPCRIFWVHGAHDWMFPLDRAVKGCTDLRNAGFDVKLHIVKDLAHAYPREKNADILKWFDPSLAVNSRI
ncbi:MAG: hypothetical protein JXM72_03825 [Deltaproteobacteria bacterium]|nr:hypothetical protein [Deltaproteobacteria bacterium]